MVHIQDDDRSSENGSTPEKGEDSSIQMKSDVGIQWNSVSSVYSAFIQIIQLIILARILNPTGIGLVGIIMIVIGFAGLFSDAGVYSAIIHFQKNTREALSTAYWFTIMLGGGIFLIVYFSSPLIALIFHEQEISPLTQITSLSFIIQPIGNIYQILLQKELNFKSLSLIQIISTTFSFLSTIVMALLGFGVYSVALGYIFGCGVNSFLFLVIGRKLWKPIYVFKIGSIKHFLYFGFYQLGNQVIYYFNSNTDRIVIGTIMGTTALGYYNLAITIIMEPISIINPIFTRVSFPYFSKMQDNNTKLKREYFDLIQTVSFVNIPIYLLLITVAPVFIPLVFGSQWTVSISLVQILTISGIIRSLDGPITSLLLAKGFVKRVFLWNVIWTFLVPFAIFIGLFIFRLEGAEGVAISIISIDVSGFFLVYFLLLRYSLGPSFNDYIKSFGKFLLFGSICMVLASFFLYETPIVQLAVKLAIGAGTYLILVILFQRAFFKMFLSRFLSVHMKKKSS